MTKNICIRHLRSHRFGQFALMVIMLMTIPSMVSASPPKDIFSLAQDIVIERVEYAKQMKKNVQARQRQNDNIDNTLTVAGIASTAHGSSGGSFITSVIKTAKSYSEGGFFEAVRVASREYVSFALTKTMGIFTGNSKISKAAVQGLVELSLARAENFLAGVGAFAAAFVVGPDKIWNNVADDRGEAFYREYRRRDSEPIDSGRPDSPPPLEENVEAAFPVDRTRAPEPRTDGPRDEQTASHAPPPEIYEIDPYASAESINPYEFGVRAVPCNDNTPVRCAEEDVSRSTDPYGMSERSVPCNDNTSVRCAEEDISRGTEPYGISERSVPCDDSTPVRCAPTSPGSSSTPPDGAVRNSIDQAVGRFPDACLGELLDTHNCTLVYCKYLDQARIPGWTKKDTLECVEKIAAQKQRKQEANTRRYRNR
jgi:hypothetical protein